METLFTDTNTYVGAPTNVPPASTGNTVAVDSANASTFCLSVTNQDASIATWYYDADGGGLSTTAC